MKRVTGMGPCLVAACAVFALWAGGLTASRAAQTPAAAPQVTVTYDAPENFSENRDFGPQNRFQSNNYLDVLQAYLTQRATRILAPGERLEITITDIKLAGAYEPWLGPRMSYVRIMKDVYPPRIDLNFKLTGADGTVLRQGTRTLRDLNYLRGRVATRYATDPLRHDKALLDQWLERGTQHL